MRAQAVQQHALTESIVFVTGEPFYVDRGGTSELRLCYTSQPPEKAAAAAQCLARSIAHVERHAVAEPALVPMA